MDFNLVYLKIKSMFLNSKTKSPTKKKKEKIRKEALKQLKSISLKKNKQKAASLLMHLIHNFFKNYFEIRYSVTDEELAEEISRRRIDDYLKKKAQRILQRLSEINYNLNHDDEELKMLIKDTQELIDLMP